MKNFIYLDNHSSTKPFLSSIEKMLFFYKQEWGALSSPHDKGAVLFPFFKESLQKIAKAVGASTEDTFFFASSGAEAIHEVLLSIYLQISREEGKTHFITTDIEEVAFFSAFKRLEKLGCKIIPAPLNKNGQVTKEALESIIRPRTALVSLSWANSLTGVIHPLHDLAEACRAKNVLFHVDASSVIGKQFFQFHDLHVDFLTLDGSILHAPRGTGCCIAKSSFAFMEKHPNENLAAIAALGDALENIQEKFDYLCMETCRLRDKLEVEIKKGFPEAVVLFENVERLPTTTAISFPGVSSEALLYFLHEKQVYATMGGGHLPKLSHVLSSIGYGSDVSLSALSFCLSYETTEEEIDAAVKIIVAAAKQLKTLSSHLW